MGILVFDPKLKADIKKIKEYAELSGNWYDPKRSKRVPGDDERYCLNSGTHKVVFSWTRMDPALGRHRVRVYRHMSMSTGSTKGRYPQVVSVFTMAHLLGFTGAEPDDNGLVWKPGDKWAVQMNEEENCILVVQELGG